MDKIQIINKSLRCFVYGLLSLLPFIGIPLVVGAYKNYFQVRRLSGTEWNAAEYYLKSGSVLAFIGAAINFLAVLACIGIVIGMAL